MKIKIHSFDPAAHQAVSCEPAAPVRTRSLRVTVGLLAYIGLSAFGVNHDIVQLVHNLAHLSSFGLT